MSAFRRRRACEATLSRPREGAFETVTPSTMAITFFQAWDIRAQMRPANYRAATTLPPAPRGGWT
jgi:hypothetical protein